MRNVLDMVCILWIVWNFKEKETDMGKNFDWQKLIILNPYFSLPS